MEDFLVYILKSAGVSTLFLLCYLIFLKKETFFNHNRVFLLVGLILSFIIPLISIKEVVWIEPATLPAINNTSLLESDPNGKWAFDWISVLSILYILGATLFLIRFLVNLLSLKQVIAQGGTQKKGSINFVETQKNTTPFSFFNYLIYNPERLSKSDFATIIAHERIHIKGLHSLDILLIHAVILVQWFNPFIWFYKDSIEHNLEFIADHGALKSGRDRIGYQNLLLKNTVGAAHPHFSNSFYNSIIKKRIVMLNQNRSKKIGAFKTLLVIPLLGFFLLSFNVEKAYHYPTSKATPKNTTDKSVKLIINKNTSNEALEKMKQNLAKDGIDFSYTVVRNDKMEIIDISVQISGKSSEGETFNSSYSANSEGTIKPLVIFYDDQANMVSFGGTEHRHVRIHSSGDHTMSWSEDFDDEDVDDEHVKVHVISDTENDKHITFRSKSDKNVMILKDSDDEDDIEVIGETGDFFFIDTDGKGKPLFYIDGKKAKEEDVKKLLPNKIESINVLKGDGAIKKYGKKAKNGVVEITTKKFKGSKTEIKVTGYGQHLVKADEKNNGTSSINVNEDDEKVSIRISSKNPPLIVIDGKEQPKADMNNLGLEPEDIESMNVLKDETAVKKYGQKGNNGVIEITTKKEE